MKSLNAHEIQKTTFKTLPVQGLVKEVLGHIEANTALMIYGMPGSQKSTFVIALCAYLQQLGPVCYKAIEEGVSLTFKHKLDRVGKIFGQNFVIQDEIAGTKGEFKGYSFVVIDSATAAQIEAEHILALKKAYPNTMFLYVYQCTKDGKFRGSNDIEHEVDIVLKADKGYISQVKNRCGGAASTTVQAMIDFAKGQSKPISGLLGNVGKIEDEGEVPGLSRVDSYWKQKGRKVLFSFSDTKIHRGVEVSQVYKVMFGDTSNVDANGIYVNMEDGMRELKADFGIRGFEFGKWTSEEDRLNYLKAMTITLTDLSELLGIRKIGFNELSICFGSRGVPKASGHFDPNDRLINLSRFNRGSFKSLTPAQRDKAYLAAISTRGLPSFVHEYGHFVDFVAGGYAVNVFASGQNVSFTTPRAAGKGSLGKLVDDIIRVACGVNGDITLYGARLIEEDTDKNTGMVNAYYQRRAEIFARIFEKWAVVKLKQKGVYNYFFTKMKHESDDVQGNIYLTNKEFEAVEPLMDRFIQEFVGGLKHDSGKNRKSIGVKNESKPKADTKIEVPKVEPKPKTEQKTQAQPKNSGQSEPKEDLDKVYRLPLNTIHTDVKRFQNRDTEYSKESVAKIVENFDANKLDPIVVWKDSKGKIFVLSGHSRFQAHKQLNKTTIPARYFQGTEAEAKEFSRVHANRAATSEGLAADIRAFKYQRDELKKTQTDLRKEWANYHKLEAYSYLDPKGKLLENLESKASDSFPYLSMRAQWIGGLRKMYPLLTNLHESEMFDYLYFDKKGSAIDKDFFINAVQTQATRLDFDPSKKLNLGKKTGTDARADTAEAQARLREIDVELKEYAAKRRTANTPEEKQAIDKFLNRLNSEKELITKNVGIVTKTQNALFGVPMSEGGLKYFRLLKKYSKKFSEAPQGSRGDIMQLIFDAEEGLQAENSKISTGDYIKVAEGGLFKYYKVKSYHPHFLGDRGGSQRYGLDVEGSNKLIDYHNIVKKISKTEFEKKNATVHKYKVGDFIKLKTNINDYFIYTKITQAGFGGGEDSGYFTEIGLPCMDKDIVAKVAQEKYEKWVELMKKQAKEIESFRANLTLFGVKGAKASALTPYIETAKRLVASLGKKQHCETQNVLQYSLAMSMVKTIKEHPNLETKIIAALKKVYAKNKIITKKDWEGIKANGLN